MREGRAQNGSASTPRGETTQILRAPGPAEAPPQPTTLAEKTRGIASAERYRILRSIGVGGMAEVFEAYDERLGRTVAIKRVRVGQLDAEQRRRTEIEAQALAELQHPNIVRLLDAVGEDGEYLYAMEYIDGVDLRCWYHAAPRGWGDVAAVMRKVALAIGHAHHRGFVHRDLKPDNILVDSYDEPHVLDFGLARRLDRSSDLTLPGTAIGTPHFMSPEMAGGEAAAVGPATDIWSIGATMYSLFVGRAPFEADNVPALMHRIANGTVPLPRAHCPQLPRDLQAIILHCLQRDPRRRYRAAEELALDLESFTCGRSVRARRPSRLRRSARRIGRHRGAVAAVLLLTATAVLLTRVWWPAAPAPPLASGAGPPPWQVVLASDESGSAVPAGMRWLTSRLDAAAPAPAIVDGALAIPDDGWLWFDAPGLGGDLRLQCTVSWSARSDALDIVFHAEPEALDSPWHHPVGHVARIAVMSPERGESGAVLTGHRRAGGVGWSHAVPVARHTPCRLEIEIEATGDVTLLRIDGQEVARHVDLMPLPGRGQAGIGMRCYRPGIVVHALRIERRARSGGHDPLAAAAALFNAGQFRAAADEYLVVASDHEDVAIAAPALGRAYAAAMQADAPQVAERARRRLHARFPGSDQAVKQMAREAVLAQREEDWPRARQRLAAVLAVRPRSALPLWMLRRRTQQTPAVFAQRLLTHVARMEGVSSLDCSGLELRDLAVLRGMPLRVLDLARNELADLTPLSQMPLHELDLSHNRVADPTPVCTPALRKLKAIDNRIADLAPLRRCRGLQHLEIDANPVRSLSPLQGLPLRRLSCHSVPADDFTVLRSLPLVHLSLGDTAFADCSLLAGLPLHHLELRRSGVRDLGPLAGLPLEYLGLSQTAVADLRSLSGAQIAALDCSLSQVRDLTPLARCPDLTVLRCWGTAVADLRPLLGLPLVQLYAAGTHVSSLAGIERLRPTLERLDVAGSRITDLEPLYDWAPRQCTFISDSLDAAALTAAAAAWRDSRPDLARQARLALALRRGDLAALRHEAITVDGALLLVLPLRVDFAAARALAAQLGCRLAQPRTPAQRRALSEGLYPGHGCWVGLRYDPDGHRWDDGSRADVVAARTWQDLSGARYVLGHNRRFYPLLPRLGYLAGVALELPAAAP